MSAGKHISVRHFWPVAAALLAACTQAPEPGNAGAPANAVEAPPVDTAEAAPRAPAGSMEAWLAGTWSFEESCATDFLVRYEADGKLDNAGETGSWKLADGKVTETITERIESGDEAPEKIEPALVRSYPVERVDEDHGLVTSPFNGRKVPILRC